MLGISIIVIYLINFHPFLHEIFLVHVRDSKANASSHPFLNERFLVQFVASKAKEMLRGAPNAPAASQYQMLNALWMAAQQVKGKAKGLTAVEPVPLPYEGGAACGASSGATCGG